MYIESIKFKRRSDLEWESGFYIGEAENCENSVILDKKYQPLRNRDIWDYHSNLDNWIQIRC